MLLANSRNGRVIRRQQRMQATGIGRGRAGEVFWAFLWLGLTSFGGPIAHLGYFRTEFVARRHWLSETDYADLVALCQFLPGPASSQVGFALGLMRAGPKGAALAWLAFTLPSAMLLVAFALGAAAWQGPIGAGIVHGLKVAAVAIVAHAVWGMARHLCPDRRRAAIALLAVVWVALVSGPMGQVAAIAAGAVVGLFCCRGLTTALPRRRAVAVTARGGLAALALFAGLLVALPALEWVTGWSLLAVLDAFYRAGALVFGGGHVVLPLLEAEVVHTGWVNADDFLAGYGAAQAIPGPLFTFAAYLGAQLNVWPGGVPGAVLALVMIFAPGLLLLVAVLPYWSRVRQLSSVQALMRGANAAVVGVLAAALYQPVWTGAIVGRGEFTLALVGFLLLVRWQCPAWAVVALMALGGILLTI